MAFFKFTNLQKQQYRSSCNGKLLGRSNQAEANTDDGSHSKGKQDYKIKISTSELAIWTEIEMVKLEVDILHFLYENEKYI